MKSGMLKKGLTYSIFLTLITISCYLLNSIFPLACLVLIPAYQKINNK